MFFLTQMFPHLLETSLKQLIEKKTFKCILSVLRFTIGHKGGGETRKKMHFRRYPRRI